jgi:alpha-N-arabinofuranosidase
VNGGVDLSKKPVWIEGPHLYKRQGWYYLCCAEGGTSDRHSQVILRSKQVTGPFEPWSGNPILTQRDLPADRPAPVTNAGHADLVQMQDGSWWAVFLASRPYKDYLFNTGRETWLLPVKWKDGWPVILESGKSIPYTLKGPKALVRAKDAAGDALAGNFTRRDEFDLAEPGPEWLQIRVPHKRWFELLNGALVIHPLPANLDAKLNASFYARRQAHLCFAASTELKPPGAPGTAAGLAAYQNENYWYFFGTRRTEHGLQLFLERHAGPEMRVVDTTTIEAPESLKLLMDGDGASYSFFYDAGDGWRPLAVNDDGTILSTQVAGGFVGTVLGPFARQE